MKREYLLEIQNDINRLRACSFLSLPAGVHSYGPQFGRFNMRTIPLSQGKVALVDEIDYPSLSRYNWHTDKHDKTCYAARKAPRLNHKQRYILMHRIILDAPSGVEVDHIDGDGLNNCRSNLRLCTHAENQRHQQLQNRNTSGFKGVTLDRRAIKQSYMARIQVNNRCLYLGYYQTAEAAARAYDIAAKEHYGEFALTNETLGRFRATLAENEEKDDDS